VRQLKDAVFAATNPQDGAIVTCAKAGAGLALKRCVKAKRLCGASDSGQMQAAPGHLHIELNRLEISISFRPHAGNAV
jgi:hypothetical protein